MVIELDKRRILYIVDHAKMAPANFFCVTRMLTRDLFAVVTLLDNSCKIWKIATLLLLLLLLLLFIKFVQ